MPSSSLRLENRFQRSIVFCCSAKPKRLSCEDDKLKFQRLQKWCEDVNARQTRVVYKALYIKQEEWEKDRLKNFDEVVSVFEEK